MFKLARRLYNSWSDLSGVPVALATLAVAGGVLAVRQVGGLQPLELMAFDQMVRLKSDWAFAKRLEEKPTNVADGDIDSRLLIVSITEQDLKMQKRWPFPDSAIAKMLTNLQVHQPKAIGLDLYRDLAVPPGHDSLVKQLKQPNVFTIQSIDTLSGPSAPPESPLEQIGFNNFPVDADGVVRRNLLFAQNDTGVLYSFSLRLALAYLQSQGIQPDSSPQNPDYLKLGQATFIPLKANPGSYQKIDDGYQILLSYRAPEKVARSITFSQVLAGNFDPNLVKDKIVLIGSTASSLKDNFYTPYSPGLGKNFKMPGIVVHAQFVSQFLDAATGVRPLFWFWSESQEVIWVISWVLLASLVAWRLRHPLLLILGVGVSLSVLFGSSFYLFNQPVWVPVAAPALGFVLTIGVVVTYRSYQAHQQQKIVMRLLGQNTSPEIAKALWRGRDRLLKSGKLPGIKLTATMLFTDIKDFSTISEQYTPEVLLEWLNELLDVISHEILNREGIVNKFTGDGVMAVFGVPMSRIHKEEVTEDAQRAVECAVTISDRLQQMNQNWKGRGLPVIQMRVGIFTGPVVVGSLGGKDRLEYGVIGDSVNTASRLESCEKHRQPSDCRILIGEETLVHLHNKFEVESWGALALKGKQQMVEIYRVIGRTV